MTPDEDLFNQIVRDYSERIYWHVRRFVNSHEDADDLVQDIFIKIWAALPSFRGESQLFTWVYRIATNEALNFVRREKVRAALRFSSLDAEMERRIDADPYFNGSAAERELSKAVARLPEKQRLVFILRYYDELPYEEMSAILGTSAGALKASYHIAQEKIRAALQHHDLSF
ncbi:MAG: RNA polymerase sigma factor [Bacteroidales bacterium]|nr:RNA polymerase sigma factor [Bacteroidales bacterium]MBR1706476.1 RNA polymerase sigma factor [Bacteroidales bacterium]